MRIAFYTRVAFGGGKHANDYMTGVGDVGDVNIALCFHELREFLVKGARCIERDDFIGVFLSSYI